MDPESVQLTSFVTPFGQFEFLRMRFGLSQAPRTFQKCMHRILGHLPFVKIFLDDILIFSTTIEDHKEHVMKTLEALKRAGATINKEKSTFFKTHVEYLGHTIDSEGITPVLRGLDALEKLKTPKTIRNVMQLVGILNWFRKYIPNLSKDIAAITDLLSGQNNKKDKIKWNKEHQSTLESIIEYLKSGPKLHYPNFSKPFDL